MQSLNHRIGESVKILIGERTLDEVLKSIGLGEIFCVNGTEVDHGGVMFDRSGWSLVCDEGSHLSLVLDI
jgi:hypothetical protein